MILHDPVEEIRKYLKEGAVILDVRTIEEFKEGNAQDSINMPLHTLPAFIPDIKENHAMIITCCRSGSRSDQAKNFLLSNGIDAINGGPWDFVQNLLDT